jgi:hypothetical protein
MSRNLGDVGCAICYAGRAQIQLDEFPRPITEQEAGRYFEEFKDMITVANAYCTNCNAKYLAWVTRVTSKFDTRLMVPSVGETHIDLSFRSTFNEEPGPEDLPDKDRLRAIYRDQCLKQCMDLIERVRAMQTKITEIIEDARIGRSPWESYRREE